MKRRERREEAHLLREASGPVALPDGELAEDVGTAREEHGHDGPGERLALAVLGQGVDNVEEDLGSAFEAPAGDGQGRELCAVRLDPGPDGAAENDGHGRLCGSLEVDEGVAEFC